MKLTFKALLLKLSAECKFTFSNSFCQQTDECTRNGTLSVAFSDIYMVKPENDIVAPLKPKFFKRHIDDMFNRREIHTNDILFE